jgi:prephenate dehydrogenase
MFRRMVVAGVGLLGGSLALDARRRGLVEEIIGYGRAGKNLRLAKSKRIIDDYFTDESEFPEGTDLLILATPVGVLAPISRAFLPRLEPQCVVTDVGSVKGKIVHELDNLFGGHALFVGAHPIAGNEKWGAHAAVSDLFEGRRCILTPTRKTDRKALEKTACFWRGVGAKVDFMDPDLHDKVLAVVSHLPHVAAYALVNTLGATKLDSVNLLDYCAGGFKDITRIASSRPEIWRDICVANRDAVGKALGNYIRRLERLKKWIDAGEAAPLDREFARANEIRSGMA